jgi:hypothetical protein
MIGVVTFFMIGASILHYSGAWSAQFLPISDSATYDNTGARYNVSRVLTSQYTLDLEAYKAYSPLFLSTTFALTYGLSFAAIVSLIVYTGLNHGKQIWRQFKNSTEEEPDIHMKMMGKYKEAPTWWYLTLFSIMIGMSFITILAFPTNLSELFKTLTFTSLTVLFSLVGISPCHCDRDSLHPSDWNNPSYHKYANWTQCCY